MKSILLQSLCFCLLSAFAIAQSPFHHYDFANCGRVDAAGNAGPAVITSNPLCICGVENDGFEINSSGETIQFPVNLDSISRGNFSLGFHFLPLNNTGPVDLLTYSDSCNADSSLVFEYTPNNNKVFVVINSGPGNRIVLEGTTDPSKCWQQVVYIKNGINQTLYVNGLRADGRRTQTEPVYKSSRPLVFNGSDCQNRGHQSFNGFFDELKIYDFNVDAPTIISDFNRPDEILTNDTVLFLGQDLQVEVGGGCPDNIRWTPGLYLSSASVADPLITPTDSIMYRIQFEYQGCTTEDSLIIKVIDPDDADCTQLLLPSAFSPNNDALNDEFSISNAFLVEELIDFSIHDRYGSVVFSTNSLRESWDGSFNGRELDPGLFVYRVRYMCKGQEQAKHGSFYLLR